MKRIIVALALSAIVLQTQAQQNNFRIEAGTRLGVSRGILTTNLPNYLEGTIQTGFTTGAFGRITLFNFYAQPEIMFAQRPGKFEDINNPQRNYRNGLSYTDMNLILGYRFLRVFRLSFGTSYGILVRSSTIRVGDLAPDVPKDAFQSSVLFLQYGLGIDLGKFCVDLRRDANVTQMGRIIEDVNGLVTDFRTSSRQWVFTLGYKFLDIR